MFHTSAYKNSTDPKVVVNMDQVRYMTPTNTSAAYYSGTALSFTDYQETYVTESMETILKMLPPSSR